MLCLSDYTHEILNIFLDVFYKFRDNNDIDRRLVNIVLYINVPERSERDGYTLRKCICSDLSYRKQ